MKGILRLTLFKDVTVLSGCGVGGGSLGYACTLYRGREKFFKDRQWGDLADWGQELAPYYDTAEHMLGVNQVPVNNRTDNLIKKLADRMGVPDSYTKTRVGVYFGEKGMAPGTPVSDPYFGGEGPDRTSCRYCGECMTGCRHGAKNTLVKNYLWFAEKLGVPVIPERRVTDIKPIPGPGGERDGSAGYEVTTERSGAWLFKNRRTLRCRGLVLSAGALGTNKLLRNCKERGSLPNVSERLGHLVRTNSEAILAVTTKSDDVDWNNSVAISSSFYPDEHTHIENVVYGEAGNSISAMFTLLTGAGTRVTRPLRFIASVLRHPSQFARTIAPKHWARRTVILLVMQTHDNSLTLKPRWRFFGGDLHLTTEEDPLNPNPRFIPAANKAAELAAQEIDGTPQSSVFEALFNMPTTAHILGGAAIGASPKEGVTDMNNHLFGYENFLVCDGSVMPANPGVNPSLTITALSERAMSKVPPKTGGQTVAHRGQQAVTA
jgi:cholesterol oxidase